MPLGSRRRVVTPPQGGGCSTAVGIESGYCEEGDTGGTGVLQRRGWGRGGGKGRRGLGSAELGPEVAPGAGARSLHNEVALVEVGFGFSLSPCSATGSFVHRENRRNVCVSSGLFLR